MRAGQVQQNQVRKIAGLEQTEILISHGLRARAGRCRDGLSGRYHRGVQRIALLQHGHQLDFLPQVQVVVAGDAVGAQRDTAARLEHPGDRRDTAGQLEVADGIMQHRNAPAGKQLDILIRHPYAVRSQHGMFHQAQLFQVLRGRKAAPLKASVKIQLGFAHVNMNGHMIVFGCLADFQKQLFRGRALAVRCQAHADTVIGSMVPLFDQRNVGRQVRAAFIEVHHAMAQQGAHAAVPHGLGLHIHVHVHIVKGRGAKTQHFHDAKVAPRAHGLVGEMLFHGENGLVEPAVQRKVAADAAQQRHGRMGMHVAQARHGQHTLAIDHLIRLKGRGFAARARIGDAASIHQDLRIGNKGNMRLIGYAGHEQDIGDPNSHGTIFLLCRWPHYSIALRI